jgi:hypothetical protein
MPPTAACVREPAKGSRRAVAKNVGASMGELQA